MNAIDRPTYEQTLDQASKLEPADQLRLLESLAALLRQQIAMPFAPLGKSQDKDLPPSRQSITALRGLGKDAWQGRDAQDYVHQERTAWDG